jgi:DNA-binding transcriptional ArsR family regulator
LSTGLAALTAPTRWIIFQRTLSKPRSVCDIAMGLPVSRPAVSQPLRVLKAAGLVTSRLYGGRRLYSADLRAIGEVAPLLERMRRNGAEARESVGRGAGSAFVSLLRTNP